MNKVVWIKGGEGGWGSGGWRVVIDEDLTGGSGAAFEDEIKGFLSDPSSRRPPAGWHPLGSSLNSNVWKFSFGGQWFIFKEFMARSCFESLKGAVRGTRAERAWKAGHVLREKGFNTPPVVAWGAAGRLGLPGRNFFVTRLVEGMGVAKFVEGLLTKFPKDERLVVKFDVLRRVGELVGRLHSAGISHGDLRLDNIIVNQKGGGYEFYLIDNERTRHFESLPYELVVKNLVQMNMIEGAEFSRLVRMRVFRGYLRGNPGLLGRKNTLARDVLSRTAERKTERRRRRRKV